MERETLKQKIVKRKLNLTEAKNDIVKFLSFDNIKTLLNNNFNDFELAGNFINAQRFISYIIEKTKDDNCLEDVYIGGYKKQRLSYEKQVDSYLDLVEAYYAVFSHLFENGDVSTNDDFHKSFGRVIDVNLNKLGYKLSFENNEAKILLIDSLAETVSEMDTYKEIKWRIIDFNYYKSTLEDKEKILEDMYKLFERDRKHVNSNLETTIGDIMNNCIRHSGKKEPCKFYEENKKYWIDNLYNLLLNAFIEIESKKIIAEYKKVKD